MTHDNAMEKMSVDVDFTPSDSAFGDIVVEAVVFTSAQPQAGGSGAAKGTYSNVREYLQPCQNAATSPVASGTASLSLPLHCRFSECARLPRRSRKRNCDCSTHQFTKVISCGDTCFFPTILVSFLRTNPSLRGTRGAMPATPWGNFLYGGRKS